MNFGDKSDKAVYVVVGKDQYRIGSRVKSLLTLRKYFDKMILVATGNSPHDKENIIVKPAPNPTGILRIIGLKNIKEMVDKLLFFPSTGVLYIRRMKKMIEQSIKQDIYEGKKICLITSVPRHDICVIGLYIKRKYPSVIWIIDWRDLWSYDENYFLKIPAIYRKKLLKLEKECLDSCDMNVTTNSYAEEVLVEQYNVSRGHVISINHSFNHDDISIVSDYSRNHFASRKSYVIKIGFLGTLFKPPKVPGDKAIQAINYVRNKGINIQLHHYGTVSPAIKSSVSRANNDFVVFHGHMKHKESLRKISKCDFLLLILADLHYCRAIVHMKLTDYLVIKRPIIAIVPEPSAVSNVIKKTNSGFVIPSTYDWGEGLECLMKEIIGGRELPKRNEKEIKHYDWQYVSRLWIKLINDCKSTVEKND